VAEDALPYDTFAGTIVGAHGIQGAIKIKPITGTSSRLFDPVALNTKDVSVWLGDNRSVGQVVVVTSAKRHEPKTLLIAHLKGVGDRSTAESLVGKCIYGRSAQREELSEDEYFVEDLIGLTVVDRNGVDMGHLAAVHSGVANDVYETDQGVLIPAVKAFVDQVSLIDRKLIIVDAAAVVMV
jgi:16S rRNA processing protein RimM